MSMAFHCGRTPVLLRCKKIRGGGVSLLVPMYGAWENKNGRSERYQRSPRPDRVSFSSKGAGCVA